MQRICVFCCASMGNRPAYRQAVDTLGRALAERGIGLVYGGGKVGLMGAVADACLAMGGALIGVIPQSLLERELAHPQATEMRIAQSLHERKALMADLSDAFITLPGGMGTWEEVCEVLSWAQLGLHRKPCDLVNIDNFYDPLIAMFDHAVAEGFLAPQSRALVLEEQDPIRLYGSDSNPPCAAGGSLATFRRSLMVFWHTTCDDQHETVCEEATMEYNDFLERVQQQGDFGSSEAESAVRTIFTTFAQQLPPNTADQLRADLPPELARYFAETNQASTQEFSLDTFFGRLNDEAGLDMSTSSQYARAVMSALREELAPDQFQALRSALPPEFISMFDTGESSTTVSS